MSKKLVLYDLPSAAPDGVRSGDAWSGNAWKIRFALNFKSIPYETEWVPFIHLQETLRSLGLKPNPAGSWIDYTVPVVRFPEGVPVMESTAIAAEIEARYPEPSLRLDSKLQQEAQTAIDQVFIALVPALLPGTTSLVAAEDLEWFKADRAQRIGMTIEQAFEPQKDVSRHYAAVQPGFDACTKVLRDYKEEPGPFILGGKPCFADFIIAGVLRTVSRCGEEAFANFLKYAPTEFIELHEACSAWATKQD